jgi:RHS repeat-associated protein
MMPPAASCGGPTPRSSPDNPVLVCDAPVNPANCPNEYENVELTLRTDSITYDVVGNRIGSGILVGNGDRMTTLGGYTMTCDCDGSMLSKADNWPTQSMTWNGPGQMISVTTYGITTAHGYDGLGQRGRKTVNGATTRFLYDGDNMVMQLAAAGAPQLEFTYYPGIDNPHAVRESSTGNVYHYVSNATGSVTALVSKTNYFVNQYAHKPFGESLSATEQIAQPFRFAGRELDAESGLYYNRARYYDPALGRFISEDPIGLAGGVNQYAYAGNSPIDFTDPNGLAPCRAEALADGWQSVNIDGHWWCYNTGGATLPAVTIYAHQTSSGFGNRSAAVSYGQSGGPDGGGPSRPGDSDTHPYRAVRSCPAFLRPGAPVRNAVVGTGSTADGRHESFSWLFGSSAGGPVLGVHPMRAAGSGWERRASGPGWADEGPIPYNTIGGSHTHPGPYNNGVFLGQGPSTGDARLAARSGVPQFIVSQDSLFWINPDGNAYGCAR